MYVLSDMYYFTFKLAVMGKTWFLLLTRFLVISYLTTISLKKEFFVLIKSEKSIEQIFATFL